MPETEGVPWLSRSQVFSKPLHRWISVFRPKSHRLGSPLLTRELTEQRPGGTQFLSTPFDTAGSSSPKEGLQEHLPKGSENNPGKERGRANQDCFSAVFLVWTLLSLWLRKQACSHLGSHGSLLGVFLCPAGKRRSLAWLSSQSLPRPARSLARAGENPSPCGGVALHPSIWPCGSLSYRGQSLGLRQMRGSETAEGLCSCFSLRMVAARAAPELRCPRGSAGQLAWEHPLALPFACTGPQTSPFSPRPLQKQVVRTRQRCTRSADVSTGRQGYLRNGKQG